MKLELALLTLMWHATAAAGPMGYAQATGYFKQDSRPTLYQPLNLLDARESTAWCSPTADPLNDSIAFGFNTVVRLEELRVSDGNNFDADTWARFARARKVVLRAGKESRTFTLEDLRGPQAVRLDPPLMGARFRLEVLDTFPSDDPEQPVCLSDVVFFAGGKPLNGPWLAPKLKFDRSAAPLMGSWYAGYEGSPDRVWSFNFDGTYHYSFEPFDELAGQPSSLDGAFDASTSRLVVEVRGKRYPVSLSRVPRKGGGFELKLDGELPAELKGSWRSAP